MHLIIYGPGRLGTAVARGAEDAGWPAPVMLGRSAAASGPAPRGDVVIDASHGAAVTSNLGHALAAGNRLFVIAATGWERDVALVQALLDDAGAAAVVAPNLSVGASLFLRLAETAAAWYAGAGFDPSIVEWHRAGKADRPSGTARALARRISAADPRWSAGPQLDDRAPLEVAAVRAGSAPGTHLVTFDGSGESIELRLTARDRSAYADGALMAARWLAAEPRAPGVHPFESVVDDAIATRHPVHA